MYGFEVVTKPSCASAWPAVSKVAVATLSAGSFRMWSGFIAVFGCVVVSPLMSADNVAAHCFNQTAKR